MLASRRTLAGLALVCFANLLLSVLMTRVFSATMFYHFTFLAVALAMFGVGLGVYVFIAATAGRDPRRAGHRRAGSPPPWRHPTAGQPDRHLFFTGTSKSPLPGRQFAAAPDGGPGAPPRRGGAAASSLPANINRVYFADLVGAPRRPAVGLRCACRRPLAMLRSRFRPVAGRCSARRLG
jgi:hypothetical protein